MSHVSILFNPLTFQSMKTTLVNRHFGAKSYNGLVAFWCH